jgi:uncharacterized protein YaiL (DUF2058 family)
MSSLREQLLKARLISEEDLERARREERKKRKEQGARAAREAARRKQEERERQRRERARADRERERARRARLGAEEARRQVFGMVRQAALNQSLLGKRRFYYLDARNRLPYLLVSDEAARKLEHGELAIVELPGQPFAEAFIVPVSVARKVRALDPGLVRLDNGR